MRRTVLQDIKVKKVQIYIHGHGIYDGDWWEIEKSQRMEFRGIECDPRGVSCTQSLQN